MSELFMCLMIAAVLVVVAPKMSQSLSRGVYTTGQNAATIVRDVDKDSLLLERDVAPLMMFMEALSAEEKAIAPKFEWYEKTIGTSKTTINGAINNAVTSLVVAAGAYTMFDIGSVVRVPSTGEMLYVNGGTAGAGTAITDTTLNIERGFGETAAAAIADGADLVLLSMADKEGNEPPSGRALNASNVYNYIQEFSDSVEASFIEAGTERYDLKNPKMVSLRKDLWPIFLQTLEAQFIWGERKEDLTTYTQPVRTTRGFRTFVRATNSVDFGAAFTKAKFDEAMRKLFLYGGNRKIVLGGSKFINAFHQEVMNNSQLNINPDTKKWGLAVRSYLSPYGEVGIQYHRLLDQLDSAVAMGVDLDAIKKKYIYPIRWRFNIQSNGAKKFKDTVEAACGLMVRDPLRHLWMENI